MTIRTVQQLCDAEINGQGRWTTWRKSPTQTTASTYWFDLSMSPGNPVPNYYAASPGVAVKLAFSTDGGLWHGSSVAPAVKQLRLLGMVNLTATVVPCPIIVCDYLMYYPFLDMSTVGSQPVTTGISLPRYTSGQLMAVIVAPPQGSGNPRFQVQYTNQAGVTGQLTPVIATGNQTVNGTIITTGSPFVNSGIPTVGPFLPLSPGDTGVQKVEAINFIDPDVGLVTLVIVKPLASMQIRTVDAPAERDFFRECVTMPIIQDDAYLNFLCYPAGTVAGSTFFGYIQTVWN